MSESDATRWDERHAHADHADVIGPPPALVELVDLLPSDGTALEPACGRGASAVWLAHRGLSVWGVDVSPVAIGAADRLAASAGVQDRCRFEVFDLDAGLPAGPPVDLVLCHLFRDESLYRPMLDRLAPGGVLAIAVLSEVGAGSGAFRATPGELVDAFAALDILEADEGNGVARLVGRKAARSEM